MGRVIALDWFTHGNGSLEYTNMSHAKISNHTVWNTYWYLIQSVLPYYIRNDNHPFFQDQGGSETTDDQEEHRRAFEAGKIDYMGQDRFQHIQEYLDSTLS